MDPLTDISSTTNQRRTDHLLCPYAASHIYLSIYEYRILLCNTGIQNICASFERTYDFGLLYVTHALGYLNTGFCSQRKLHANFSHVAVPRLLVAE
jgi:hypothetical protein